jgi:hypothetical protein
MKESWKDNFKEGKELILATASKSGQPNANIVISLGFVDGNLLVANCQMVNTIKNLTENQNICVIGGYYRISGNVELFDSGKYFDLCVQKSEGYKAKHAIIISVDEVFDLDKGKIIQKA